MSESTVAGEQPPSCRCRPLRRPERAIASAEPPQYGDADGDGREDVTFQLTDGLSAGSVVGGDPVYARWEAEGQGYLAEIAPGTVTGVGDRVPGGLHASVTPNPSGRDAQISYTLPRDGHVRLRVYDIAGHWVANLVDGWRPAGRHRAQWEGSDTRGRRVRYGIYYVRLETEELRETRKIVRLDWTDGVARRNCSPGSRTGAVGSWRDGTRRTCYPLAVTSNCLGHAWRRRWTITAPTKNRTPPP